jgi:hypothetical protein
MVNEVNVSQNPVSVPNTGNTFQSVTNNLLSLLTGGAQVYATIAGKTKNAPAATAAQQQAPSQQLISTEQRPTIFGLTQNQALMVAAGLTGVLILSMVLRRGK